MVITVIMCPMAGSQPVVVNYLFGLMLLPSLARKHLRSMNRLTQLWASHRHRLRTVDSR